MISDRFPARPIHFTKCHHRETIKKAASLIRPQLFLRNHISFFSGPYRRSMPCRVTSQMRPGLSGLFLYKPGRTTFIASTCLLNRPCDHSPSVPASAAVITFSRLLFTVLSLLLRTITELTIKRTASLTKTGSSFHVAMVTQERFELPTP